MKESRIHHVSFVRTNRRWTAQIFIDENTCVSWQPVKNLEDVQHIIETQLKPLGIPATIEND